MKPPWVSRLAFDLVSQERDRLVEQNAALTDALTRVKRFETGMTETPRPPRRVIEPMPERLADHLAAGSNPGIRRMRRSHYMQRVARGETWEEVEADVLAAQEPMTADGNGDQTG